MILALIIVTLFYVTTMIGLLRLNHDLGGKDKILRIIMIVTGIATVISIIVMLMQ